MKPHIMVIGDCCEDEYIYGKCSRLCPDAPVPVFKELYNKHNRGMAGNVTANLEALGADVKLSTHPELITKTRYMDERSGQMLLRVDREHEVTSADLDKLLGATQVFDAIVISDYNKGYLSRLAINSIAKSHPLVILDTKKHLGDWCKHVEFIKINQDEYETNKKFGFLDDISEEQLIVTLGHKGCRYKNLQLPVEQVHIKDMTGAGDTFISGFTVEWLRSKDTKRALEFANQCATEVVQKRGVSIVSRQAYRDPTTSCS